MGILSHFAERSVPLVAAAFHERGQAEALARELQRQPGLANGVALVAPGDPAAARKFEPESRGIRHTLVRSHVVLGAAALVSALTAWLVYSWPAAAHSLVFTAAFVGAMGTFLGMLVAGLLTLRPDQGTVIRAMRARLAQGQWAVVVHPTDQRQADHAYAALQRAGGTALRSF